MALLPNVNKTPSNHRKPTAPSTPCYNYEVTHPPAPMAPETATTAPMQPAALYIFSLPTTTALALLNAWKQQRQEELQSPEWQDICAYCGHANAPLGPDGPSNRHGWECGGCGCC